jgi:hypothetical protein
MIPANAQIWVDALRSGMFKQCTVTLTHVNYDGKQSHCCLGVACQVAIANGVPVGTWLPVAGGALHYTEPADQPGRPRSYSGSKLPPSVEEWLGISDDRDYSWLATMNDGGASFADIADEIERQADRLFNRHG